MSTEVNIPLLKDQSDFVLFLIYLTLFDFIE